MELHELKRDDMVTVAMFAQYVPMLESELNEIGCTIGVPVADSPLDADLVVTLDSEALRRVIARRSMAVRVDTVLLLATAALLVLAGVARAPVWQGVAGSALVLCGFQLIVKHRQIWDQKKLAGLVEQKERDLGWID